MPTIQVTTTINSSIEICFDLSRSIDFHTMTTAKTGEKAIAGITSGLIGLNETVTWQATHFGIKQELTSRITAFDRPFYFRDEQVSGIFKSIYHEHKFEEINGKTIMTDIFIFESPFGFLGKLFNKIVLTNYLRKFIIDRNQMIKDYTESDKWTLILNT
jgi:ligand-binding SRPBCC domain-containing protein